MKISELRKESRNEETVLVANVDSIRFGRNTIWVSVPNKYEEYLTDDRYDGFLIALLYPAMFYGENIEIDGAVSKRLLRNVNIYIQEILLAYNNKLNRISITAKESTSEIYPTARNIGTGFSGGIDSFCTIYDNFVLENDLEYKIDTLVCFNVGSHGSINDKNTKALFKNRYEFLSVYSNTVDLPLILVDSNIHYYHHEWGHFYTCILTLLSGALTLQKMFKKYYMASVGWNYNQWINEAGKQQRNDISVQEFSEPYLLPLLSTETTEFILDGIEYSRVQKTAHISEYSLTQQYLNVCLKNEPQKKNCGECPKCIRVGLTLSAVDKLDNYNDVYDIETFRKNKYSLMCRAVLLYKSNVFMRDIVDFAKKNDVKYPSYFSALLYPSFENYKAVLLQFRIGIFLWKLLKKIIKNK